MNRILQSLFVLAALSMCLVGIRLRLGSPDDAALDRSFRTPDEAMYLTYASVLRHEGWDRGTRLSTEQFILQPKLQTLPPPTRIGYLLPLSLAIDPARPIDAEGGILLSKTLSIAGFLAVGLIAWRWGGPVAAFAAWAFMASFSPELFFARKIWQDGLMTLLGCLAGATLIALVTSGRSPLLLCLFFIEAIALLLVKESGLLVIGVLTLSGGIALVSQKRLRVALALLGASCLALGLSAGLLSHSTGGFERLSAVYRLIAEGLPNNPHVSRYQNAPAHLLPIALLILTGPALLLAAGARLETPRTKILAGYTLAFLSILAITPYARNLRFASPAFGTLFILAGLGARRILDDLIRRWRRPWLFALLSLLLLAGWAYCGWRIDETLVRSGAGKDLVPEGIVSALGAHAF